MTEHPAAPPNPAPPNSAPPNSAPASSAAADWITIWHSEWAALTADREVQEGWQRMAALWAVQANAVFAWQPAVVTPATVSPDAVTPDAVTPEGPDAATRRSRPEPTPRAPSVADAPDAVIASLLDRIADLERRANLAADAAAGPLPRPGADRRNRRVPPPSLAARPP